jgi:hypothetical protein
MAFDKTPPSHKKSARLFKIILCNKFTTGKLDITEEKKMASTVEYTNIL